MSSDPIPQPGSTPEPVVPTPLPHAASSSVDPSAPLATAAMPDSSSGLTPNVAAGLAMLIAPITGIVFLFLEKRSQFVRFWAMQSVFFGAGTFIFGIVAGVIHMVLAGIFAPLAWMWSFCTGLIDLGLLLLWLYMMFQAFSGKEWELPVLGPLARQQLAKTPPLP